MLPVLRFIPVTFLKSFCHRKEGPRPEENVPRLLSLLTHIMVSTRMKLVGYLLSPPGYSGKVSPRVSCAKGIISRPMAKAIEVRAMGVPSVPIAATAPARPKFTPAPMKRPIDVQKEKAVARASVPNSPGNHRLKIAKLHTSRKNRAAMKDGQRRVGRQVERPAECQRDRHHHAK